MDYNVASGTAKHPSVETLTRRNRLLTITVALLLVGLVILTALFITDKLTKDTKLVNLGGIVGDDQQTIRELFWKLNSTVEQLRSEVEGDIDDDLEDKEAIVKDSIKLKLKYSKDELEEKITSDVKDVRHQIDLLVGSTQTTVNGLMNEAKNELKIAYSHMTGTVRSLDDLLNFINETESLVDAKIAKNMSTFYIGDLIKRFNKQNDDIYTVRQEEIVDGIPLFVSINLQNYVQPLLYLYVSCYNDTNVPVKEYLRKSVQFTVWTKDLTVYSKVTIPMSPIPACRLSKEYETHGFIGVVSDLHKGLALANDTLRLTLKLFG